MPESQTAIPSGKVAGEGSWAALGLVLLLAAVFSAPFLTKELWHDEVYTLTHFVNRGFRQIFTDYHLPNNHILFSAALRTWSFILVPFHAPVWGLRLLSWFCSLGAAALLFLAIQKWRGPGAAFWAAVLLVTAHAWLNFSCQVRGYALSSFLSAAGLFLAVRIAERPKPADVTGMAVLAVLAGGVLPTNLLVFLALAFWLILEAVRLRDFSRPRLAAIAAGVASPFAGLLWYVAHPAVRSKFFEHVSGGRAGAQAFLPVLHEVGFALFHDIVLLVPLVGAGFFLLVRRREREGDSSAPWTFALAVAVPLLSAAFVRPYSRNFVPFFPLWFALFGTALDALLRTLPERSKRLRWVGPVLAGLVIFAASWRELTFSENYLRQFAGTQPQSLYYQYYQVGYSPTQVVKFLARHSPEVAFADSADIVSLNFHARLGGIKGFYFSGHPPYAEVFRRAVEEGRNLFFVTVSGQRADDMLGTLGWPGMPRLELKMVQDTGFFKVFQVVRAQAR